MLLPKPGVALGPNQVSIADMVAMGDGSVRAVSTNISQTTWEAVCNTTPAMPGSDLPPKGRPDAN